MEAVSSDTEEASSDDPVPKALELVVSDFIEPGAPATSNCGTHVSLTAAQQLFFYSSYAWETFIRECAAVLKGRYLQVKLLGGANDEGVDVAGFKTELGFEGAWDCWQGKHYANALTPSDGYPEMLKLLRHVTAESYRPPDAYYFAAPRGCGKTFSRLLSKPTELKSGFLAKLIRGDALTAGLTDEELSGVRATAEASDFSIFKFSDGAIWPNRCEAANITGRGTTGGRRPTLPSSRGELRESASGVPRAGVQCSRRADAMPCCGGVGVR